jgi:hypothetical protein
MEPDVALEVRPEFKSSGGLNDFRQIVGGFLRYGVRRLICHFHYFISFSSSNDVQKRQMFVTSSVVKFV